MRKSGTHTKSRRGRKKGFLIFSAVFLFILVGGTLWAVQSQRGSKLDNSSNAGSSSLPVGVRSGQTLQLYSQTDSPTPDKANTPLTETDKRMSGVSEKSAAIPSSNKANLSQYLPGEYKATPMPSENHNAPTSLVVPKQCTQIPDSSYTTC